MRTPENNASLGLVQKVRQELAANRLKAAVLGGLALVFIGVLIKALVSGSSPESAVAEVPAVVASTPASPLEPVIRPVPEPPAAERPATAESLPQSLPWSSLSGGARPVLPDKQMRAVSVRGLPRTLERDIFDSTDWTCFSPDFGMLPGKNDAQAPSPAASLWQQMREAMAEQKRLREQKRQEITKELAELQLQSTMTGPVPAAYISGRLVNEGDTISGFSVVRINDKSVKLRKDGLITNLAMP